MSDEPPSTAPDPPLSEADYQAVAGLLMESARGRWFLAEYARRQRQADSERVLAAVARMESTEGSVESVRRELAEMAQALARLAGDVAALRSGNVGAAGPDVPASETAPPAPPEPVVEAEPADEIVWIDTERRPRHAAGLPGPVPPRELPRLPPEADDPSPTALALPEICFVDLPAAALRPSGSSVAVVALGPDPQMPPDGRAPGPAPAVPEPPGPIEEPICRAELEARAAAALAVLAEAGEQAVADLLLALAEPEEPPEPERPPAATVPTDPLAPLAALSEEEKIALFG